MSQALGTEHDLRQQTEAARDLLGAIAEAGGSDDEALIADAIEGETALHEAIEAGLDEIDELEANCLGLKLKEEQFASRRLTAESRIARIRAAIERAMVTVDLPTLRLPSATLSVTRRKPGVVIEDEARLPSRFFVQPNPPPPTIDKKAIATALADGPVEGARLDNGSVSLTIRRN